MKKSSVLFYAFAIAACFTSTIKAQTEEFKLQKVLRVNALNPGIEYELPILKRVVVATNLGVGYGGSYKNTTEYTPSGWLYMISPFLDIEFKHLYSIDKRAKKGKKVNFNSSNYWGIRCLTRGKEIDSNFDRYDDWDCAIGPVWGLQRSIGRVHLLFDAGMSYYFDSERSGVSPNIQLNIGYSLFKK